MPLNSSSRCADVREAASDVEGNLIQAIGETTTIVTGANSGIGKTTAQHLSYLGGTIVLACRNLEKGRKAVEDIRSSAIGDKYKINGDDLKLFVMELDLSSIESVEAFSAEFSTKILEGEFPPLRLLVLNAGIYPTESHLTVDGLDTTFQVNHFGHFLLTKLLLQNDPQMFLQDENLRIVVVSSLGHKLRTVTTNVGDEKEVLHRIVGIPQEGLAPRKERMFALYGSSKLCNIYFAQSLNDLAPESAFANGATISACSLHPGVVITGIVRQDGTAKFLWEKIIGLFAKDLDQGASTTFYCCLMPDEEVGGAYFNNCKQEKEGSLARGEIGDEGRNVLWKICEDIAEKIIRGDKI